MSGSRLFVDTNILIYLLQGDPDILKILDGKEIVISVITELELRSFPKLNSSESSIVSSLINDCQIVNLNEEIKKTAVDFRRKKRLKLPDAIVAASAYYSKLPLFTADKDFERLDKLDVVIYEV